MDNGNFDRPKVGGVSADDLLNDSVPSFRVSFINAVIKKTRGGLLILLQMSISGYYYND